MNDMFELWSLPWHALQRHLAASCGIDGVALAAAANAQRGPGATVATTGSRAGDGAGLRSGSWLARARIDLHSAARRGR